MQTILVIDDDDTVRSVIISGLGKNGFKALQATNGRDGIKIARKESPDLILCDLNMAEADGSAMFALFRKTPATAQMPFILMTGQPVDDSPGDEVLVKPFTLAALLQAIRRQLKEPQSLRPSKKHRKNPGAQKDGDPIVARRPKSARNASGLISAINKPSIGQLEKLLARVQLLREEERTRIARAIHDNVSQTLTVVAIELSILNSSLRSTQEAASPEESISTVKKLTGLVNNLIQSSQEITAQLRPKVLDEFGLVAALEWLTQQVKKKTGVTCELTVSGTEKTLDPNVAAELYRLSEEILSNAARHAHASVVSIHMVNLGSNLFMEISDSGIGIDARQINDPDSLGLLSMHERVARLGGILRVIGVPGKGTTITVQIPLSG